MDRLSVGLQGDGGPGDLTDLPQRVREVEARVEAWWAKFSQDVFPLLVPRTKWQLQQPSLQAGAIVLVRYQQKFGKDRYRLGRVAEVRKDEDGLVRTAWVGLRNLRRAVREEGDVCRAGLVMNELPVQRLVLLLPPEEQPQEILAGLANFPKMPAAHVVLPGREHRLEGARNLVGPPGDSPERPLRRLAVAVPEQVEEMGDLPRPQRPRGRPRRGQ